MRRPLDRVERQRLPQGSYAFSANPNFLSDQTEADIVPLVTGTAVQPAKIGDPVIVSQITPSGTPTAGLYYWANVYADGFVTVGCTNVTAAPINRPATTLNFTVIPH